METNIDEIPSPHTTLLVATYNAGFGMTKACTGAISIIDMPFEFIKQFSILCIHQSNC